MSVYFDAAVTVDMPVAAGIVAGSIPILAGAVTVDMPEVDGTLSMVPILSGAVTVDMPVADGSITPIAALAGAVTVDMPIAAGTLGYALAGAVTVDMPVAAGIVAGSIPILAGAVTADMPKAAGVIGFTTPSTYTVLVQNLKNGGVSTYTNFSFNSACFFNGEYLVADSANGIHKLSGSTDNGTAISSYLTLGATDFGTPEHKNIPDVYLDFAGGAMTVATAIDANAEGTARSVTAPTSGVIETRRARLPLGNIGRHWQIKVTNVSGSDFEIQEVQADVAVLSRKL